MQGFPFSYEPIAQSTWAYLSSLLMIALFFKFNRFWSVRNFDLFLIILLAPGILLVDFGQSIEQRAATFAESDDVEDVAQENGTTIAPPAVEPTIDPLPLSPDSESKSVVQDNQESDSIEDSDGDASLDAEGPDKINAGVVVDPPETKQQLYLRTSRFYQRFGYIWLFSVGALFMTRMLLDPILVRRPLLPPNLSIGGMVFLGCSLLAFLFANIYVAQPSVDDLSGARGAVKLLQREAAGEDETLTLQKHGPGFPLFHLLPIIPAFGDDQALLETDADLIGNDRRYAIAAKILALLSQLAIVVGLVLIGYYHFSNFRIGVGMTIVYLLIPYTSLYMGHVLHVLPAALIVWAIHCFRRPSWSGVFIGLAIGVSYYPLFLLPLWMSFYWDKGVKRFTMGVVLSMTICIAGLLFTSIDLVHFGQQIQATFGFRWPAMDGLAGIWGLGLDQWYRVPILAAFVALSVSFVFWPIQKDLGSLFSYSCAVMVGVQFWHGFGGGLYMAWYMPLALMTIFRPAMHGRIAATELRSNRSSRSVETPENILPAA